MRLLLLILLLPLTLHAQTVRPEVWRLPHLKAALRPAGADTLTVLNFWATWCKPCLEEMPLLLADYQALQGRPVKLVLVSLDFKKELDTKLLPFLEHKRWPAKVVLLDEPDYNAWIPLVDRQWQGNIPVTLLLKGGKRRFIDGELKACQLLQEAEALLKE